MIQIANIEWNDSSDETERGWQYEVDGVLDILEGPLTESASLTTVRQAIADKLHGRGCVEFVVVVTADADLDDCLAGAVAAYVEEHPEAAGYDLAPSWTDGDRETVTLIVPAWRSVGILKDEGSESEES